MINFLIFILFFFILILSTIGYGLFFQKVCFQNFKFSNENKTIYVGFFGLSALTFISLITSLFFPHNFIHNIIIHLIGLFFLFFIKTENKKIFTVFIYYFNFCFFCSIDF